MNFERPKKSEFCKNEKKTTKKTKENKNILEISSFYTCVPKTTIRYSPWYTQWHNLILSFRAIFCLLPPPPTLLPNTRENQNFEKKKKSSADVIILNKTQSNDVCLLRNGVWLTIFCHFRSFFALLAHYWPRKLKFGKM